MAFIQRATFSVLLAIGALGCALETGPDGAQVGLSRGALETSCGHYTAPILAGEHHAGNVVVSNTATHLIVHVTAIAPWTFERYGFYAGLDPVPVDSAGTPLFAHLPYTETFAHPTDSFVLELPLSDFVDGDGCGQVLNMALKTGMVAGTHRAAGWAYGEHSDAHGNFSKTFTYTLCCQHAPVAHGCTRTQGYWKNHNVYASAKRRIAWPTSEDTRLCAAAPRTWYQALTTAPKGGDATLILAHQYIAARLNLAGGASSTAEIDRALSAAGDLLAAHCGLSIQASSATGEQMVALAGVLDAYNNGLVGPGHCD